jgi:hypothetical protein
MRKAAWQVLARTDVSLDRDLKQELVRMVNRISMDVNAAWWWAISKRFDVHGLDGGFI